MYTNIADRIMNIILSGSLSGIRRHTTDEYKGFAYLYDTLMIGISIIYDYRGRRSDRIPIIKLGDEVRVRFGESDKWVSIPMDRLGDNTIYKFILGKMMEKGEECLHGMADGNKPLMDAMLDDIKNSLATYPIRIMGERVSLHPEIGEVITVIPDCIEYTVGSKITNTKGTDCYLLTNANGYVCFEDNGIVIGRYSRDGYALAVNYNKIYSSWGKGINITIPRFKVDPDLLDFIKLETKSAFDNIVDNSKYTQIESWEDNKIVNGHESEFVSAIQITCPYTVASKTQYTLNTFITMRVDNDIVRVYASNVTDEVCEEVVKQASSVYTDIDKMPIVLGDDILDNLDEHLLCEYPHRGEFEFMSKDSIDQLMVTTSDAINTYVSNFMQTL